MPNNYRFVWGLATSAASFIVWAPILAFVVALLGDKGNLFETFFNWLFVFVLAGILLTPFLILLFGFPLAWCLEEAGKLNQWSLLVGGAFMGGAIGLASSWDLAPVTVTAGAIVGYAFWWGYNFGNNGT